MQPVVVFGLYRELLAITVLHPCLCRLRERFRDDELLLSTVHTSPIAKSRLCRGEKIELIDSQVDSEQLIIAIGLTNKESVSGLRKFHLGRIIVVLSYSRKDSRLTWALKYLTLPAVPDVRNNIRSCCQQQFE